MRISLNQKSHTQPIWSQNTHPGATVVAIISRPENTNTVRSLAPFFFLVLLFLPLLMLLLLLLLPLARSLSLRSALPLRPNTNQAADCASNAD